MVGRSNGRFPLGSVEELCMEELCCGRIVRGRIVRGRIVLWKNCAWKNCVWKNCAWKNCGRPILWSVLGGLGSPIASPDLFTDFLLFYILKNFWGARQLPPRGAPWKPDLPGQGLPFSMSAPFLTLS